MLIILVITSFLIAITAIIGNGFICFTIKQNSNLHTATFVLIVGQAISDMLFAVCLMGVFIVCSEWFIENPNIGAFPCSIVGTMFTASYIISSLTMTVIAIERYVLVFYPLKPKWSLRRAWFLNCAIYIFGHFLAHAGQVGYIYHEIFGTVE